MKLACMLTLTTITCLASEQVAQQTPATKNQTLLRRRLAQASGVLLQLHRGRTLLALGVTAVGIPAAWVGKRNHDLVKEQEAQKAVARKAEPNYCSA